MSSVFSSSPDTSHSTGPGNITRQRTELGFFATMNGRWWESTDGSGRQQSVMKGEVVRGDEWWIAADATVVDGVVEGDGRWWRAWWKATDGGGRRRMVVEGDGRWWTATNGGGRRDGRRRTKWRRRQADCDTLYITRPDSGVSRRRRKYRSPAEQGAGSQWCQGCSAFSPDLGHCACRGASTRISQDQRQC